MRLKRGSRLLVSFWGILQSAPHGSQTSAGDPDVGRPEPSLHKEPLLLVYSGPVLVLALARAPALFNHG